MKLSRRVNSVLAFVLRKSVFWLSFLFHHDVARAAVHPWVHVEQPLRGFSLYFIIMEPHISLVLSALLPHFSLIFTPVKFGFLCLPPCPSDHLLPFCLLQIPWQCRSLVIGPIGAWWPTGRRRHASGASTQSRRPLWTSSMIYLRGTAFAWVSYAPKTSPSLCRWCGRKSATASS